MLRITSAKVTASPGVSGWVQIHGFAPSEPGQIRLRGQLFTVVASRGEKEGIEAISFEREIIGRLRQEYYGGSQEKTFDALRNATQKVVDEFSTEETKIEIACCAFADGVVYSSAFGGGAVLISRDGSLASILESANGVIVASGFPKEGDIIIAGTKSFFEKVSTSSLKSSLTDKDPQSAIEDLTPLIYGAPETGTAGAIIIKFEQSSESVEVAQPAAPAAKGKPVPIAATPTVSFRKKLSSLLGRFSKVLPRRSIYIRSGVPDEAVSQNRKLTLSVGIILLVILAVSVGFGIRQKKINDTRKKYQGLLTEATAGVDQAVSLASVNPDESRQLFLASEGKLAQIQSLKVKDPKIDELQKKIEESRAAVLGEYVANPELFLDLGLLSSGFKGDVISFSGGNIYVLDKGGARVVGIAVDTKKSKVIAGPTVIENPLDLASYENNVYVLFSDGVYLVGNTKTKVIDKSWSGDALIYAFAGNLYVLDKGGNAIFRYSGQGGNSFGSQQNWLSSSTRVDFSRATGWTFNGAIYVLYPNSRVLKFSLGSPQSFSVSGVNPDVGNIDAIYADPDNQYVYFLDKAGKRVVVIDKNGKYKAQYLNDQISEATSLVASEAQKKIILLTGEKLLSIEIKND
jgi:hypothetical protein